MMTPTDAREQIGWLMMDYCRNCNSKECDDCVPNEAVNLAGAALEKQEPKEPKEQTEEQKKYDVEVCPVCGHIVRSSEYSNKYCAWCGQKINWGERGE